MDNKNIIHIFVMQNIKNNIMKSVTKFGYEFRYFFNAGRNPYGFDSEGLDVSKNGIWVGPVFGVSIEEVKVMDERQINDLVDEAEAQKELDVWED